VGVGKGGAVAFSLIFKFVELVIVAFGLVFLFREGVGRLFHRNGPRLPDERRPDPPSPA